MGRLINNNRDNLNISMANAITDYHTYEVDMLGKLTDSVFKFGSDFMSVPMEINRETKARVNVDVRFVKAKGTDNLLRVQKYIGTLIFKDVKHVSNFGEKFFIGNDTWIVTDDTAGYRSVSSCQIRKCNTTVKWYDADGTLVEEPVVVEFYTPQNKNTQESKSTLLVADAYRYLYMQNNSYSDKLTYNVRFIFNKMVWKITHIDRTSTNGLLMINLEQDQIREEDNMTTRIARNFYNGEQAEPAPENEAIVGNDTVPMGISRTYSVVNGGVGDTYTFTVNNNLVTLAVINGTSCKITGGNTLGTVTLTAVNNNSHATLNKTIKIESLWG